MKDFLRVLLGMNAASLVRGARFGLRELTRGSRSAFSAVHPMEERDAVRVTRLAASIPSIALEDILGERRPTIQLTVQKYEDGMLPSHEASALLSILVAENPAEVLEVGTYMGFTAKAMAINLPQAVIHTLDLPPDYSPADGRPQLEKDDQHLIQRRQVGREFQGHECESRIRQHFGDSASFDFAKAGAPGFFFIDGAHTYEYCKNDSEKCLALSKGRGVFLWHDCDESHPGILQFIAEWRAKGRDVRRIAGTALGYWKSL